MPGLYGHRPQMHMKPFTKRVTDPSADIEKMVKIEDEHRMLHTVAVNGL
ncbi:MAG: hypothetical protein IH983_10070 [Planctomycetes bacterium]|nr:hypothetical protein [Planctomycetota bacterium]